MRPAKPVVFSSVLQSLYVVRTVKFMVTVGRNGFAITTELSFLSFSPLILP